MKWLRFLVALIPTAAAAIALSGLDAFASNGSATPFKSTYPTGPATTWTCSGAHVVNRSTLPGSKDSEICVVTGDLAGYVAGTYSSDPSLGTFTAPGCIGAAAIGYFSPVGLQGWQSDYFANLAECVLASSWTMTLIDNHDGTFDLDVVAYYPV